MKQPSTTSNFNSLVSSGLPENISLPLEIRLHGRGGQGGVTCAKLIASVYAQMDLNVQSFGDYGAERSGAPVRAFTRVDQVPIKNRNKVYRPDHLLVLDAALLGPDVMNGVPPGAIILLNSTEGVERYADQFDQYCFGIIDATGIARGHGIGTSSVVIINTTIVGAYAKLLGLSLDSVETAYTSLGLSKDFNAAKEAYEKVQIRQRGSAVSRESVQEMVIASPPYVKPQIEHTEDIPPKLRTGGWSNQLPKYEEHIAPCNYNCPAGNDVVGFIQALKESGPDCAAEVLLRTQPLPSVCGRVCPAPCMTECNRGQMDGPVNIRSIERWISDKSQFSPKAETAKVVHSFAVIGGGPGGLSAAYKLALSGHQVTIFEKNGKLGGVLRYGIPSFRLPDEILDRDLARILTLGIKVEYGKSIDKKEFERLEKEYDSVIVCIGLSDAYSLSAAGEELDGIIQGLDFLSACRKEPNKSYFFGDVVVIGGGNTAIDCARSALRSGATSVKLVYRRSREEMPAIPEEIVDAISEGVEILTLRQPVAFRGDGVVSGIVLAEVELGEPGRDGRRSPIITKRTNELSCSTVLLALGQPKELKILPDSWGIRESKVWNSDRQLNVWLAGDCATADGTVTHAIGNGRLTALAALAKLDGIDVLDKKILPGSVVSPAHINFSHFPILSSDKDRHQIIADYRDDFSEVNLGLVSAEKEASRCFSCGRCTGCDTCLVYCPDGVIYRTENGYRIDDEYCKGCGICVAECPRRAMEFHEKINLED